MIPAGACGVSSRAAANLVEDQRQDVVLVVLPRGLAAQDICCTPEVGFELLECELHHGVTSTAVANLRQVTRTVFAVVVDAVSGGYVESLARPGGPALLRCMSQVLVRP
jgi:hypothetical protein